MFAFSPQRPPLPASLVATMRPATMAATKQLPVESPWSTLLPERGLRRGSTVTVVGTVGSGLVTLAFSLLGEVTQRGYWLGLVGLDDSGVVAMREAGIDLSRTLFLPRPRDAWAEATADLFDGIDVVVLRPPGRASHAVARRLTARAKERGAVLVVITEPHVTWPVPADLTIDISDPRWSATAHRLQRSVEVRITGRGAARRTSTTRLGLPGPSGRVEVL